MYFLTITTAVSTTDKGIKAPDEASARSQRQNRAQNESRQSTVALYRVVAGGRPVEVESGPGTTRG